MNGKVQGIIVCAVAAACLGGTMVFLKTQDGDGKGKADSSSLGTADSSTVSDEEHIDVLKGDTGDILSVEVKNKQGGFTLENNGSAGTIKQLSGISQNEGLVKNLLENTANLQAEKVAEENPADISKYGLDKTEATFTVKYADGTSKTLLVGDASHEGDCRYFMVKGEKKVYMAELSKLAYYTSPVNEFVSNSLIPAQDSTSEQPYGKMTITRRNYDYVMTFEDDSSNNTVMSSAQIMTSPIFAYLDVSKSTNVTHGMWGLTATGCIYPKPTAADMKKCGLDKPLCKVHYEGDNFDYTLNIGNAIYGGDSHEDSETGKKEISGYYCTLEGGDGTSCIYAVDAGSLPWVNAKPDDVIANIVIAKYLADMDTITVTADKNYEFKITAEEEKGDNGQADTKAVTLDGKNMNVDNFKSLYQYMISCPTGEIYFKEPKGEKFLTIKVKDNKGDVQTLEYFKDSSRRCVLKINGKASYKVQTSWTDKFIENVENIAEGKNVTVS